MAIVTLQAVGKSYRGRELFRDVDYRLEAGRIHALQGPNGCGKTVLLKVITAFVKPDYGTVEIDPAFLDPRRVFPKEFGVIIDRPGYVAGLTGLGNLRRLAQIRGVIGDPEIRAALERVGLDPATPQRVRHYSLGMKQRLALAQAFMEDQKVLVLDEPFNALDATGVAEIRALLSSFRDEGRTILFTSHNSEDIDLLADTVHRVDDQRLVPIR